MNRLIVYTCCCHKEQIYLIDKYNVIVKPVTKNNFDVYLIGAKVSADGDYPFKEIDDIQDLLLSLTR